jgi:hypothetical protein
VALAAVASEVVALAVGFGVNGVRVSLGEACCTHSCEDGEAGDVFTGDCVGEPRGLTHIVSRPASPPYIRGASVEKASDAVRESLQVLRSVTTGLCRQA